MTTTNNPFINITFGERLSNKYQIEDHAYVALWLAVLGQLYCDLTNNYKSKYKQKKQVEAELFVLSFEGKERIRFICHLLDINYNKVINFFVLTIKKNKLNKKYRKYRKYGK